MSTHDPHERRGYNVSDPRSPYCPERFAGARPFNEDDVEVVRRRLEGPDACELTELDITRSIARRLRGELIYGTPANVQIYSEQDVPTSRNLPLFMEFVFKVLTGKEASGEIPE